MDRTLVLGLFNMVVTEFGIAYLKGGNLRERAMELISIAIQLSAPG